MLFNCLFIKVSFLYQGGLMGLAAVLGGLATDTNVLDPAAVPYLEVHNLCHLFLVYPATMIHPVKN